MSNSYDCSMKYISCTLVMLYSNKSQFPISHWYILSGSLGFVHFRTKEGHKKLNNGIIEFLDHENIGLDTKILSLRTTEPEILPQNILRVVNFEIVLPAILNFWIKKKGLRCSIMLPMDKIMSIGSLKLEILASTHSEGSHFEFFGSHFRFL